MGRNFVSLVVVGDALTTPVLFYAMTSDGAIWMLNTTNKQWTLLAPGPA